MKTKNRLEKLIKFGAREVAKERGIFTVNELRRIEKIIRKRKK